MVLNKQLRGSSLRKTISPIFSVLQLHIVPHLGLRLRELSPYCVSIPLVSLFSSYLGSHVDETSLVASLTFLGDQSHSKLVPLTLTIPL